MLFYGKVKENIRIMKQKKIMRKKRKKDGRKEFSESK